MYFDQLFEAFYNLFQSKTISIARYFQIYETNFIMATENSSRNLQLNSSLSVLFYVTACFGALPYSPIEYRNNKLFQVSYITLGLSIFSTICNVAQYHFSTNMFTLSVNKESQTSKQVFMASYTTNFANQF